MLDTLKSLKTFLESRLLGLVSGEVFIPFLYVMLLIVSYKTYKHK